MRFPERVVVVVALLVTLLALAVGLLVQAFRDRRGRDRLADESLRWAQVADQVGGLEVEWDAQGRPRLVGTREGVRVTLSKDNDLGVGFHDRLGMRCTLPELGARPATVALWTGPAPDYFEELLGPPRPLRLAHLDGVSTHDLYTRAEGSGSDWWQDPELRERLVGLPGGCLWFERGSLVVLFDRLDAESVRLALEVPSTLRRATRRPTLH